MKIKLNNIPIRDVADGYVDNAEQGCVGYGGRLNIRPAFQREFIYKNKQREAVIDTVTKDFPLNAMYWLRNDDGKFEMLDGQQRTISICQYVHNGFSIGHRSFDNLTDTEREQILNYRLMIYICQGNDREKLDWFRIINIAGVELTDAKNYFSKSDCVAAKRADKYLSGASIRQDYLETALKWIVARDGIAIEDYMSAHQHAPNCNELWLYFQRVMDWVQVLFPKYRREMKGLDWGIFYNEFGGGNYDAREFEARIVELMEDDDVTNNRGIYEYLLDGDERHLNIRKFSPKMKRAAWERQKGLCARCGEQFMIEEMHADHITPWSKGGKTIAENCKMLCADCNRRKSNI